MAITAIHRAFKHFVVKGLGELGFGLGVTPHAKLGLVRTKHCLGRLTGLLRGDIADERKRAIPKLSRGGPVRSVAFRTTDVVSPVLASTKIIMVLFTGMAGETGFGGGLRVETFKGDYFCDVAS